MPIPILVPRPASILPAYSIIIPLSAYHSPRSPAYPLSNINLCTPLTAYFSPYLSLSMTILFCTCGYVERQEEESNGGIGGG